MSRASRSFRAAAAVTLLLDLQPSCAGREAVIEAGAGASAGSIDRFLAERIRVMASETVFTLFALLNVAGYDEENNPQGMHAVRNRLRHDVLEAIPAELLARLRNFYQEHQAQATTHTYTVVAMATSGPPEFAPAKDWAEIAATPPFGELGALPGLLREFYGAVPVRTVYVGVRVEYERSVEEHSNVIRREVSRAMAFCRVKGTAELAGAGELKHAVLIPNLLDSYDRAFSFVLGETASCARDSRAPSPCNFAFQMQDCS